MPFNLLKKYPELLEILHLGDKERKASLYRVYRRDIEDNEAFKFREKRVYPIKSDGEIDMQREFMHLTTTDDKEAEGAATKKRVFEPDRSRRLHWIRHHIEERTSHVLEIFSCEERDMKHRKNIYRTYVYDTAEKYDRPRTTAKPLRVLSVDRLLPEYAGWRKEDEKNAEKEVGGSAIKNARLRIGSCQNEPRNPF